MLMPFFWQDKSLSRPTAEYGQRITAWDSLDADARLGKMAPESQQDAAERRAGRFIRVAAILFCLVFWGALGAIVLS